ncbi:hypothetical protein PanWU01x14_070450, partial [Parasponia andersonii]
YRDRIGQFLVSKLQSQLSTSFQSSANLDGLIPRVNWGEDNERIFQIPNKDEIIEVVQSMAPQKSPGHEWFPALLYQRYWDIVGDQVVEFI